MTSLKLDEREISRAGLRSGEKRGQTMQDADACPLLLPEQSARFITSELGNFGGPP